MGVCGCGKSTIGELLAQQLSWAFRDGDDFHSPANVAKMKSGTPLNDDDRLPWLQSIRRFMNETEAAGQSTVMACSSLREIYRDVLGRTQPWVRFVYLSGSRDLLSARMRARSGHYMPPALLDSQLATLEVPTDAITVDIAQPPGELVSEIIRRLHLVRSI